MAVALSLFSNWRTVARSWSHSILEIRLQYVSPPGHGYVTLFTPTPL